MSLSRRQIIDTLASSLGEAKAVTTVDSALSALGFSGTEFRPDQARELLGKIAGEGGLVKAASTIAAIRLGLGKVG